MKLWFHSQLGHHGVSLKETRRSMNGNENLFDSNGLTLVYYWTHLQKCYWRKVWDLRSLQASRLPTNIWRKMQPFSLSLSTPFYRCVRSCHATMHTAANWSIDGTHLETSSRRYRYVCSFNLFARQLFICLQCRRILVDGLSVLWPTCCFHQANEMRGLGRERGSLFFPSPPLPFLEFAWWK